MKIWIDDLRNPRQHGKPDYLWFTEPDMVMSFLDQNIITAISFDHDLGEGRLTGYDIAKYIEELAATGRHQRIEWTIHSSNPVGRTNIELAMMQADRYWDEIRG